MEIESKHQARFVSWHVDLFRYVSNFSPLDLISLWPFRSTLGWLSRLHFYVGDSELLVGHMSFCFGDAGICSTMWICFGCIGISTTDRALHLCQMLPLTYVEQSQFSDQKIQVKNKFMNLCYYYQFYVLSFIHYTISINGAIIIYTCQKQEVVSNCKPLRFWIHTLKILGPPLLQPPVTWHQMA